MPESQVADDDRALFHGRLRRWSEGSAFFQTLRSDSATCPLAVLSLLRRHGCVSVASKPYFCAAVLLGHLNERNVDDQCERTLRMFEICVRMYGLRLRWRIF